LSVSFGEKPSAALELLRSTSRPVWQPISTEKDKNRKKYLGLAVHTRRSAEVVIFFFAKIIFKCPNTISDDSYELKPRQDCISYSLFIICSVSTPQIQRISLASSYGLGTTAVNLQFYWVAKWGLLALPNTVTMLRSTISKPDEWLMIEQIQERVRTSAVRMKTKLKDSD
jgi:hypothetical protein